MLDPGLDLPSAAKEESWLAERGLGLLSREAWRLRRLNGWSVLLRRCSIASPDAWLLRCGSHSRFPSNAGSLPRAEPGSDGALRPLPPFVSFGVLQLSLLISSISLRLSLPCKMQGCLSLIDGLKAKIKPLTLPKADRERRCHLEIVSFAFLGGRAQLVSTVLLLIFLLRRGIPSTFDSRE